MSQILSVKHKTMPAIKPKKVTAEYLEKEQREAEKTKEMSLKSPEDVVEEAGTGAAKDSDEHDSSGKSQTNFLMSRFCLINVNVGFRQWSRS